MKFKNFIIKKKNNKTNIKPMKINPKHYYKDQRKIINNNNININKNKEINDKYIFISLGLRIFYALENIIFAAFCVYYIVANLNNFTFFAGKEIHFLYQGATSGYFLAVLFILFMQILFFHTYPVDLKKLIPLAIGPYLRALFGYFAYGTAIDVYFINVGFIITFSTLSCFLLVILYGYYLVLSDNNASFADYFVASFLQLIFFIIPGFLGIGLVANFLYHYYIFVELPVYYFILIVIIDYLLPIGHSIGIMFPLMKNASIIGRM